jgi:ABC-type molybdate transport system ATPase subunit
MRAAPKIQLVFQDPYSSLNPRIRIGDAIGEAMLQHKLCSRAELYDKVIGDADLRPAPQHYNRFPHEFSGGQRQRIGIARALISTRILSLPMSRSRPSMCRFRRRSSICFPICATIGVTFCLSPTTSAWWSISAMTWR